MRRAVPVLLLALAGILAWILLSDPGSTPPPAGGEPAAAEADAGPAPGRMRNGGVAERVAVDEEEKPFDPRAEKAGDGDFSLHGTVVDERGAPVPQAWVAAYSSPFPLFDYELNVEEILERPLELGLEPLAATRADEDGRFLLDGLYGRGNYLVARADKRLTRGRQAVKPAELDREEGILLHTVAGASLTGRVVDHAGAAVAGAEIFVAPSLLYLVQAIRTRDLYLERVFTDGAGRFSLEAVPAGARLTVQAFDGATHPGGRDFGPLPERGEATVEVTLARTGSLTGRVVDDEERAAAGAVVAAVPLDLRMVVPFVRDVSAWTAEAGSDGRFRFERLPRRNYLLLAQGRAGRAAPLAASVGGEDSAAPEPLVLQTRREFQGRVVNAQGEGIAGARVSLGSIPEKRGDEDAGRGRAGGIPNSTEFFLEAAREILPQVLPAETWSETDARGRFRLSAWTKARVTVEAPGYRAASFELPKVDEDQTPVLVMLKPGAIRGRVLEAATEEPARFFLVRADQITVSYADERAAGADGENPIIVAEPPPPPPSAADAEFEPLADEPARESGEERIPLAADEVAVFPRKSTFGGLRHTQFHDDGSGRFHLENLMPGEWVVEARADGFVVARSEPVEVVGGETVDDVVLRLARGATLRGRVVEAGTGEPLAGALVTAGRGELSGIQAYVQTGLETTALDRSGRDGHFELRGVEERANFIHAFAEGFAPKSIEGSPVKEGDVREGILIEVERGGTIQGTVVDRHGMPLAARMVGGMSMDSQDFWQAATDEQGYYRAENVKPGSYFVVTAALDDEALFTGDFLSVLGGTRMKQVYVESGKTATVDIEDLAAGGCHLRGRLVRNGMPIPDAAIFCLAVTSGGLFDLRIATARTNEDGEFAFKSLAPGDYRAEIQSEVWDGTVEFSVEDVAEDFVVLDVPEGVVRGLVVSEQTGLPVEDASVSLVRDDSPGGILAFMPGGGNTEWGSTGEDGRYEFTGVAPGRYHVEVTESRWGGGGDDDGGEGPLGSAESETFELFADQVRELETLRLPVAAAVSVVVTLPDGESPEQGFQISARSLDDPDAEPATGFGWNGSGTVSGLQPGDYEVRVRADGYAAAVERGVTVVAGQTTTVELVVEEGVQLLAQVMDANGQALPGASIEVIDSSGRRVDDLDGPAGQFARALAGTEGAIRLGSYAPGSYTVIAAHEGRERRRTVLLSRGAESELVKITF